MKPTIHIPSEEELKIFDSTGKFRYEFLNEDLQRDALSIADKDLATLEKSIDAVDYEVFLRSERMEFVGDKILGLLVAKELYNIRPAFGPSELTVEFQSFTRNADESPSSMGSKLYRLSQAWGVRDVIPESMYITLNDERFRGTSKSAKSPLDKQNKFSDIAESLIGAVYFDHVEANKNGDILTIIWDDLIKPHYNKMGLEDMQDNRIETSSPSTALYKERRNNASEISISAATWKMTKKKELTGNITSSIRGENFEPFDQALLTYPSAEEDLYETMKDCYIEACQNQRCSLVREMVYRYEELLNVHSRKDKPLAILQIFNRPHLHEEDIKCLIEKHGTYLQQINININGTTENLLNYAVGKLEDMKEKVVGSDKISDFIAIPSNEKVQEFQQDFSYEFRDSDLLKSALTTSSLTLKDLRRRSITEGYEQVRNFERLEFVGDRVLGFLITKVLYDHYPSFNPGDLDRDYKVFTKNADPDKNSSGSRLYRLARALGVADIIREDYLIDERDFPDSSGVKKPSDKQNKFTDVAESLIGATYIDCVDNRKKGPMEALDIVWKKLIEPHYHFMGLYRDQPNIPSYAASPHSISRRLSSENVQGDLATLRKTMSDLMPKNGQAISDENLASLRYTLRGYPSADNDEELHFLLGETGAGLIKKSLSSNSTSFKSVSNIDQPEENTIPARILMPVATYNTINTATDPILPSTHVSLLHHNEDLSLLTSSSSNIASAPTIPSEIARASNIKSTITSSQTSNTGAIVGSKRDLRQEKKRLTKLTGSSGGQLTYK